MSVINSSENEQFVRRYLNLIGLKACQNNQEFWELLESNHEEDILDQLDQALQEHNEDDSRGNHLYEVKNQNLKLSLNVSNFSADLYKSYFDWFINHQSKTPRKILDLGCDNGIVTCFYAILFPQSEVIGIDIQENAIKCANELARKLNQTNITFLKIDFKNILNHFPRNSFDLITSLRSFHEIIGVFPDEPSPLSTENLIQHEQDYLLNFVQSLLTNESSEFISCERLSGFSSIAMWANFLEKAGLHVKFDESDFIEFHEIGQEQQMPVLVTNQQKSKTSILNGINTMYKE